MITGNEQGVELLVEIHVIQEVLGMPSIFFIGLGLSKNKANLFEDKQKILKYKVTKTNPNP